jgi:hypothetical protein
MNQNFTNPNVLREIRVIMPRFLIGTEDTLSIEVGMNTITIVRAESSAYKSLIDQSVLLIPVIHEGKTVFFYPSDRKPQ